MTVDADGGGDLVEEGPVEEEEEEGLEVEAVWVGDEYSNFFFRSSASFATCGETGEGELVSFRLLHRCWHKKMQPVGRQCRYG